MFSAKEIVEKRESLEIGLAKKGWKGNLQEILQLDKKRRELLRQVEPLRATLRSQSREMGRLNENQRKPLRRELAQVSKSIQSLESELKEVEKKIHRHLLAIPNPALPSVPDGTSEAQNSILREWGERRTFSFTPLHHLELGEKLGILDVRRAAKVSGSRFAYILGDGVRLQFALLQYAMQFLEEHSFQLVLPPVLAREEIIQAMGYLPEAEEDMFALERDGLRLAATSEQTLGPYFKGEIIPEESLPIRLMGYSTCFRREAGSHGKDVKGIMRVHQFDKVEMFIFCDPLLSETFHEELLVLEEQLVQGLGIPYRVVSVCGGELGFPAAKKYDIECWIPSEGRYRETHSCSNCTDFQAKRLGVRLRRKATGKLDFVHTLNATAIACGRMLIALLENFQNEDGSVAVPKALLPWMGGRHFLTPSP